MLPHVHPLIEIAIWAAFALGGLLCVMNFSLPLRYAWRRWKGLPDERYISPVPLLGSLFVFLALRALDVVPAVKILGWILIAIDVGGIHWMIVAMISYALRALVKRPREAVSGFKWPAVNPVAVFIFILLALLWLVKAFA